jgi:hypothetical protein
MMGHRRPRAVVWVTTTLLGTGSCAHDKDRSGYPFECGELDFYDVVALVYEFRAYEVACGTMPGSAPLQGLSWRQVAAEYREQRPPGWCHGNPELNHLWSRLDRACAIEATVNLQIYGYQVMGCPTWHMEGQRPSDGYYLPFSDFSYELERTMELICLPSDG